MADQDDDAWIEELLNDPRTKILEDEEYAYLIGLGKFVEAYARFEAALFIYLQHVTDIRGPMAVIAFGGLNVKQRQQAIRRVWRVEPPPAHIKSELEDVFKQSLDITDVRNSMLHYGTVVSDDGRGRVTSNSSRVLDASDTKTHRVNGPVLTKVTTDILKCGIHLISLALHPTATIQQRMQMGYWSALADAWRYIPQPDESQRPRRPKS